MPPSHDVQRHLSQLSALHTVASAVNQSLNVDDTLAVALRTVVEVLGVHAGAIGLADAHQPVLLLRAHHGWDADAYNPLSASLVSGPCAQVLASGVPLVLHDVRPNEVFDSPLRRDTVLAAVAIAPMHVRGQATGVLAVASHLPYAFDAATVEVLCAVADTVGVALDNARLYEDVHTSQNRLNAIVHSTTDGIIALDQAGRVQLINSAAATMLGVDEDALLTHPLLDAPLPSALLAVLRPALDGHSTSLGRSVEARLGDGRVLLVNVAPVAAQTLRHQDDAWVVVLQDVTHLRAAGEQRAQFIQAAAHDMKNPLGVTLTALGTLEMLLAGDEMLNEVVEVALSGVHRLQTLLDDLLRLEGITSGYVLHMDDVDVPTLLAEASSEARPQWQAKQQRFTLDVPPNLPTLCGDGSYLCRAVVNYLVNAAKYTDVHGHITLRAYSSVGSLHIEVTDDGIGIPQEDIPRLFERFYRAPAAKGTPGSGLGLAIVKSIVEAHNGTVYVRSRAGEGSTFGFTLPLSAPSGTPATHEPARLPQP